MVHRNKKERKRSEKGRKRVVNDLLHKDTIFDNIWYNYYWWVVAIIGLAIILFFFIIILYKLNGLP
jgi:hypothetical protein